jgi:hypothetical protein
MKKETFCKHFAKRFRDQDVSRQHEIYNLLGTGRLSDWSLLSPPTAMQTRNNTLREKDKAFMPHLHCAPVTTRMKVMGAL